MRSDGRHRNPEWTRTLALCLEPVAELGVEVVAVSEAAAGQEARLQVAVDPLHASLAFRVALGQHHRTHPQRALQAQVVGGVDQRAAPPHRDRRLTVIDPHPGHRPQLDEQTQMAAQHVGRLLRADHRGQDPPRVARHPDQHRQPGRLAVPDRDVVVGEPQVPLRQLARPVLGAPERLRQPIGRAQLGHPVAQHRHPPRPADPLGDHRRRHVRRHRQQPADRRLERVHRRTRPLPHIPRRRLGPQRRPHRVPGDPQMPDDRLDGHPLGPMQPPDLCPLLHVDHFPSPVPAVDGRAQAQVRTTPSGGPDREGSVFDR